LLDTKVKLPSPYFRVGESVPSDGIYRAYHNSHRLSHEVTLLTGETFPPCVRCGTDVHFELLREVKRAVNDPDFDFKIKLYEIPHPAEDEDKKRIA
jgi:hypothetical protein